MPGRRVVCWGFGGCGGRLRKGKVWRLGGKGKGKSVGLRAFLLFTMLWDILQISLSRLILVIDLRRAVCLAKSPTVTRSTQKQTLTNERHVEIHPCPIFTSASTQLLPVPDNQLSFPPSSQNQSSSSSFRLAPITKTSPMSLSSAVHKHSEFGIEMRPVSMKTSFTRQEDKRDGYVVVDLYT